MTKPTVLLPDGLAKKFKVDPVDAARSAMRLVLDTKEAQDTSNSAGLK